MKFNINDIVKIMMPIHNKYNTGRIIFIEGYDVLVKLNYKNIIVHRYLSEIIKK